MLTRDTFLVANDLPKISGAWKLMLLGDGSPTRHLQLLTNYETKIKLISMQIDPLFNKEGPREINQLKEPLIRKYGTEFYNELEEVQKAL